jgi:hypothetical protein
MAGGGVAAEEQRSRAGAPEEEEREGPRDSFAKTEKSRDLTVN